MTTKYKTKEQVKAEQASQDKPSQDANSTSIPVIEGLESSLEKLYALNRGEAHRLTQTVKVAAYKDEFQCAIAELEKGLVSPSFFENLQKSYSPVAINHVPMLLLTQSGVEAPDTELDALCERNDALIALERTGNISPEEVEELSELQIKLRAEGLIE
jgi:hypothetical protein